MSALSVDALVRRSRSALRLAETVARNPISTVNPSPVILLGNQKSGTTAIGAVLATMTGSTVTLDLVREVVDPTFDRVKRGDMSFDSFVRRNRFQFSRDIIKEPQLTVFFDELRSALPAARFGLVVRDPRENLRSILDRLDVPGHTPERATTTRHRNDRAWRLVLDGRWLGIDASNPLDVLAHRWNLCADVYLDNRDTVALIRYEDFVADKRSTVVSLAESLGLDVGPSDLATSVTDYAYQPPGRHRGDDVATFFGSENLARIEQICGARMVSLGYTTATP